MSNEDFEIVFYRKRDKGTALVSGFFPDARAVPLSLLLDTLY